MSEDLFTFTNSVDPDEMQHYAAFHLGLHCLPNYPFWDFSYTKVIMQCSSKKIFQPVYSHVRFITVRMK